MKIIYTIAEIPENCSPSIFLAGPTPRTPEVKSWRPKALKILENLSYDGIVFVPENRNGCCGEWDDNELKKMEIIEWEEKCLTTATCILFWIPREMKTMPALTTNIEWGVWQKSRKVVLGIPPGAKYVEYIKYYAGKYKVHVAKTLERTIKNAIAMIGLILENCPSTNQLYNFTCEPMKLGANQKETIKAHLWVCGDCLNEVIFLKRMVMAEKKFSLRSPDKLEVKFHKFSLDDIQKIIEESHKELKEAAKTDPLLSAVLEQLPDKLPKDMVIRMAKIRKKLGLNSIRGTEFRGTE